MQKQFSLDDDYNTGGLNKDTDFADKKESTIS